MLFKDEVLIQVRSGKGGDGAATFRRAKFIPKGGPDGGDGGDGGDVILHTNPHMRTLSHLHRLQWYKAQDGQPGSDQKCYGKSGNDTIVEVPPGTLVYNDETGELIADLVETDKSLVIAQGGKGGRGNVHFKSSIKRTPMYAEDGKPAVQMRLRLELKLIAHVGLVGLPNAGKSTLISRITAARPKIADYPFTTLEPNLGVMSLDEAGTQLLIADIPGLIEGAHKGKGLGHKFLRHIERTRLLFFVLDITDKPRESFDTLRSELENYSAALYTRDYIIALNKIDMLTSPEQIEEIRHEFDDLKTEVLAISALTGTGLSDLKNKIYHHYLRVEEPPQEENHADTPQ